MSGASVNLSLVFGVGGRSCSNCLASSIGLAGFGTWVFKVQEFRDLPSAPSVLTTRFLGSLGTSQPRFVWAKTMKYDFLGYHLDAQWTW